MTNHLQIRRIAPNVCENPRSSSRDERTGAAGCRTRRQVLDPFAGAATTALAARQLGRQFVGIELNIDHCALAKARLLASGAAMGGEAE
ncbi:DNA methyltransferase [Sphaerimonospora mesophila]|uniref:DNA methyltransferase n=1 Tax=Sphaerimonospora mesophila TaxID=37483 RepID=UPI000A5C71FD